MPETCIDPVTDHETTCFNCSKTGTGKTRLLKCSKCLAISYCGRECQVADRPRHKWNCVPVMVTEYEGKGRGLVASRDFKVGELIFIDKLAIQMPSTECGLPDSEDVSSLMKHIEKLPSEAKKLFYRLEPSSNYNIDFPENETGSRELKILFNNANEDEDEGWMLFINMALINHSCAPNAYVGSLNETERFPMRRYEIRAIQDISKGEEITICYLNRGQNLGPRPQRQFYLQRDHSISDCICLVCSGDIPEQEDLIEEYMRIQHILKFTNIFENPHERSLLDWKREAMMMASYLDIAPKLYIGTLEDKYRSYCFVAEAAHMARDPGLLERTMTLFETLEAETKFDEVRRCRKLLQQKLSKWLPQFKSAKLPRKEEIDCLLNITDTTLF